MIVIYYLRCERRRKCRNWQTSKTKDLVMVTSCGFKSHLPHLIPVNVRFAGDFSFLESSSRPFFTRKTTLKFSGRLTSIGKERFMKKYFSKTQTT